MKLGFIGVNDLAGVEEDAEFAAEHGFEGIEFNYDSLAGWLEKIALKKGFGKLLAEGFVAVIEQYGEEATKCTPSV